MSSPNRVECAAVPVVYLRDSPPQPAGCPFGAAQQRPIQRVSGDRSVCLRVSRHRSAPDRRLPLRRYARHAHILSRTPGRSSLFRCLHRYAYLITYRYSNPDASLFFRRELESQLHRLRNCAYVGATADIGNGDTEVVPSHGCGGGPANRLIGIE